MVQTIIVSGPLSGGQITSTGCRLSELETTGESTGPYERLTRFAVGAGTEFNSLSLLDGNDVSLNTVI